MMILYGSLIGVLAGTGMLLVAAALRSITLDNLVPADNRHGFGLAFLAVGPPLAVFAPIMALTWPMENNPPLNKLFAEPTVLLGALLTLAGCYLLASRDKPINITRLWPVSVVVSVLGFVMLTAGTTIWSYQVVRTAPPQEPIFGRIGEVAPALDNFLWGLGYVLIGLATAAAPLWHKPWVRRVAFWVLAVVGVYLLVRSILGGYRAQPGLLINFQLETGHRW